MKHWIMPVDKPDDIAIRRYIGKMVKVIDDNHKERVVEIQDIKGNLRHPTKFQIDSNGQNYLISMLDFYAQMNGEYIPREVIEEFDRTQFIVSAPRGYGFTKQHPKT